MSLRFLLDTNILSEPARPIPNANVLQKLEIHQSEVAVYWLNVHYVAYKYHYLPR